MIEHDRLQELVTRGVACHQQPGNVELSVADFRDLVLASGTQLEPLVQAAGKLERHPGHERCVIRKKHFCQLVDEAAIALHGRPAVAEATTDVTHEGDETPTGE